MSLPRKIGRYNYTVLQKIHTILLSLIKIMLCFIYNSFCLN